VMLLLDRQKSPNVLIPVSTSIDRDDTDIEAPSGIVLEQNYPNPFNPTTVVGFQLSVVGDVTLKVYDALGREVATLVNERLSAGTHSVEFDASDLASGVYLYRLTVGGESFTKRMTVLK
jgi:hypothetical protein